MKKEKELIHYTKFWKPDIQDGILLFKGHFNTFDFDKHVHEDYTITLVHDGNMSAFLNGSSHHFGKSTILTINPDQVHACKTQCEEGYSYSTVYVNQELIKNISNDEFHSRELFFDKNTLLDETIYKRLSTLIFENELGLSSKLEFEVELIEVLKNIFRKNTSCLYEQKISAHDRMIKQAKEFINENFALDLSLDNISKELDISKYHFLRLFKEKVHLSPHSYLMIRRIEKAKQALQKGESILDTAYSCGFNDQSHLNRRFKAVTGTTPGIYKKFFN